MIVGDAESLKVLYDGPVQLPFGVKGPTCESINTNVSVQLRMCPRRRTFKTVRFVNHQTNVPISRKDLKSLP